jgi:hypothetical protein
MLSAVQVEHLRLVEAYADRYHKRLWAGRAGTRAEVLDELVALGMLDRVADEHRTRWWYGLTADGRRHLERSA